MKEGRQGFPRQATIFANGNLVKYEGLSVAPLD